MHLNEIKLIGFVGQDAELKSLQNSKELVRFDVATKASWKNRDSGEYDSRTEWHRIVVWGNLTKFAQTLKKGEHIYVSGELRYREYEKAVGESGKTVTMPVAEIHATKSGASIRGPQKMVQPSSRPQCAIRQGGPLRPASRSLHALLPRAVLTAQNPPRTAKSSLEGPNSLPPCS